MTPKPKPKNTCDTCLIKYKCEIRTIGTIVFCPHKLVERRAPDTFKASGDKDAGKGGK